MNILIDSVRCASWLAKFLQFLGFAPTPKERKILEELNKSGYRSMKVVGRGTLTMDAKEVCRSKYHKDLLKRVDKFI